MITTALDLLIDDLAALVPPPGLEATHTDLIDGYRGAREGFRSLADGDEDDLVRTAAEQVGEVAELLGVDRSL